MSSYSIITTKVEPAAGGRGVKISVLRTDHGRDCQLTQAAADQLEELVVAARSAVTQQFKDTKEVDT